MLMALHLKFLILAALVLPIRSQLYGQALWSTLFYPGFPWFLVSPASIIDMTSVPSKIEVGTRSLTLHCSIVYNPLPTDDDTPFFYSVVIARSTGEHIASVSQIMPASVFVDVNSTHVSGAVSGQAGERAFLEVSWDFPTQNQTGKYYCDVQALDKLGRLVPFHKEVEVQWAAPTIQQLADGLRQFGILMDEKDQKISALQDALNMTETTLRQALIAETVSREKEVHDLQVALKTETDDLKVALKTETDALRHVETGVLTFGKYPMNSNSEWPYKVFDRWYYHYKEMTVVFNNTYTVTPVVFLTMSDYTYVQPSSASISSDYVMELVNVTITGFTARVRTGRYSNNYIHRLAVSWVSIPR